MIKTDFKLLITTLIAIALFANITLAVPGIPHAFYGSVTWNGQPAPDGTTIVAKINGVEVASTITSGGKYGYPIGAFYVADPNNDRSGKTINFFVNGVDTGITANFCTGCFNLCGMNPQNCASIDLSASGGTSPPAPGGGGGSTGGPSGVIGGTTGNQTTGGTTPQGCQEKWACSEWGECKDGVQARTCNDENKCGTRNNEPFSSQPCTSEERKEAEQKAAEAAPITGFFLGMGMTEWTIAIIAGIVIAIIVIFLAKRKVSKK